MYTLLSFYFLKKGEKIIQLEMHVYIFYLLSQYVTDQWTSDEAYLLVGLFRQLKKKPQILYKYNRIIQK